MMTRSAKLAATGSCVTMTILCPKLIRFWKSLINWNVLWLSSPNVGSSKKMISALELSAVATLRRRF